MSASPPPQGIYVPVPTFFAKEGSANYDHVSPPLDLDTQSAHSLFLVKGGVKGLVILGSTGEAIFVRNSERHELIKSQRKTLDDAGYKDRPIIAGTATQNIDDTVDMIKDSQAAGAEYAMVLGPAYFAPATSQAGLQKWFEVVADRSPIPILMYVFAAPKLHMGQKKRNIKRKRKRKRKTKPADEMCVLLFQLPLPRRDQQPVHCSGDV